VKLGEDLIINKKDWYNNPMKSIQQVLQNFNPTTDKYVSREFQTFGLRLAEDLNDYKHKSLYIKMAKTEHRAILEKALSFAIDSNAKNKGALFMWKVQQLKAAGQGKSPKSLK